MTIEYHRDVMQGSEQWHALRCGLLTASEMGRIITPTLKVADNDKSRAHLWELLAQRITRYVEPHYISDDMLRGHEDEATARALYARRVAPVERCGFVTNDRWGFKIGCSPDGLVGDYGAIEAKSRRQRFQVEVMVLDKVPAEHMIQCQTSLLVTERKWLDYISYSGGLPMHIIRVHSDPVVCGAIVDAAAVFEQQLADKWERYRAAVSCRPLIPTERREEMEMIL